MLSNICHQYTVPYIYGIIVAVVSMMPITEVTFKHCHIFSRTLQFAPQIRLYSQCVVCLSLSVTRVYCDKTTEARITQFSLDTVVAKCLNSLHGIVEDETRRVIGAQSSRVVKN